MDGWRGSAQISLESRDFKAAGELIGELQASMQLIGVNFTVAPETRRRLEKELLGEGLASFRQRAETIRASLGGSTYKIVHIHINQGGYHPQPPLEGRITMQTMAAPPRNSPAATAT